MNNTLSIHFKICCTVTFAHQFTKNKIMMKHLLCILAIICMGVNYVQANSTMSNDETEIPLQISGDDKIKEKDPDDPDIIIRGPGMQPAYAYLSGSTVSIDFTVTFSTVVVTVTQAVTGEVVATRTLFNPSTLNLSLEGASSGEYLLAIEADAILLEGSFTL